MSIFLVSLLLLAVSLVVLFFTGWLTIGIDVLFVLAHRYHQKLRRSRRPKRIFLIRHGESQANIDPSKHIHDFSLSSLHEKIFSFFPIALAARLADSKVELTERGQQQALEAGAKLRSMIGDESIYVYMSPYRRSRRTWENIRNAFSPNQILTERQDPRLREQEFGNIADLQKRPQELEEQKDFGRFFYRFSCGESGADVYDRASLFLDTLFREMDDGHHDPTQNIVIVSHGLFMRLFLMRYFRWNVDELERFKQFGNCEICELKKINGVYTLDGHIQPPTKSS